MKLNCIINGLKALLLDNNYSQATIIVYEREWHRIEAFLLDEYGDTEYDIERGFNYLEHRYNLSVCYNNGQLSQNTIQMLRVVNMLEDYRLHKIVIRRYHKIDRLITVDEKFIISYDEYVVALKSSDLSLSTIDHYKRISVEFLDCLNQLKLQSIEQLTMEIINTYLNTLAGFSYKTVEQKICGLRHFLRFLYSKNKISINFADKIHMPKISKSAKIPTVWSENELKALLSVIDRNNPVGKRDYAMIMIACVLGLRIGDIKNLRFNNFNWEEKKLSIIQHKTKQPLIVSIPDTIGWAVIDYIKNARPKYYETDIIFLKHMPPFDPIGSKNHMSEVIKRYMNKAGLKFNHKAGFHSLRHSAASMLLDMETPLPVITNILGHSDSDITAVYLKTDIKKLMECVLDPEDFEYE